MASIFVNWTVNYDVVYIWSNSYFRPQDLNDPTATFVDNEENEEDEDDNESGDDDDENADEPNFNLNLLLRQANRRGLVKRTEIINYVAQQLL